MPKMIGNDIFGATQIEDNATQRSTGLVSLTYRQAILLKPSDISKSLDTTDKGSKGTYAKRWYRWFASVEAIRSNPVSTLNMLQRADKCERIRTRSFYIYSPIHSMNLLRPSDWGESVMQPSTVNVMQRRLLLPEVLGPYFDLGTAF